MTRTTQNPLAALGLKSAGFSTCLAKAPTAVVSAGEQHADLTDRGRTLLAKLLQAEPDVVARVESLLAGDETADQVSPEDAAAILGVSRPTVVRWAAAGLLTDYPVGSHHRFSRAQVLKLRDERATAAEANRRAAAAGRALAEADGDLDQEPTPQELISAGQALRDGDTEAAERVFARARRADARRSAAAAGIPAGS